MDRDTLKAIQTHINGSSRPGGDPTCSHRHEGKSTIVMNDDTMGGCGSVWECMCERCGKVWYD